MSGWTQADVDRVMGGTPVPLLTTKARGRIKPQPGVMNKNETAYAYYLEAQKHVGDIAGYWFESVNLKLAKELHYRPDFMVLGKDGVLYLDDVKGRTTRTRKDGTKKPAAWIEGDARPKILCAARIFPFVFRIAYPLAGGWVVEQV